ncbi:Methylmalonic aciduria type A protein [Cavenderia fasciculata]|uniref:Methylmalonic aciduria type A protein n=1 Tax=Cavenderia fasciculata TaxID=261658 RepID=F4Q523_CACFS|nr:Methylmalonic aciduria type A protein [Cavenderia fasciculata]EGG17916.1 Methylmalonic aciduria type A protein [Cavenderia fasciculata]|eukprot:XP_004356400.1 Methylmalonic aciduria type A protein [Cavenderia fasciculata]
MMLKHSLLNRTTTSYIGSVFSSGRSLSSPLLSASSSTTTTTRSNVKYYSSTVGSEGITQDSSTSTFTSATSIKKKIPHINDLNNGGIIDHSKNVLYEKLTDQNKKLIDGISNSHRVELARLITLIESSKEDHQQQARLIISILMQIAKKEEESRGKHGKPKSFRIGISGPPGAGKSTFIEAFGRYLTTKLNKKVAVLAIDPSSVRTGGSILGDKTRMVELSKDPNAYVRPSSSRGSLGGITKSTSDTMVLCEGAGYDVIIVETVGVGQSEVSVEEMVDIFMLLVPPANGDELQGLKKGIVEMSDLVVVNKADGELLPRARFTVAEYMSAFKVQRPKSENWRPKVLSCSSLTNENIDTVWNTMNEYQTLMIGTGELGEKRSNQKQTWMWRYIEDELMTRLHSSKSLNQVIPILEQQVKQGEISPSLAADQIIKMFMSTKY